MTRKIVVFGLIAIVGLLMLNDAGVLNILLEFVLVGAIPGTTLNIPPNVMMIVVALIACALALQLSARSIVDFVTIKQITDRILRHKARLPKRRFGRI